MPPKYPQIKLKLSDRDGNAFSIISRARRLMHNAGLSNEEINAYINEATRKDYNHVIQTTMEWFDVS